MLFFLFVFGMNIYFCEQPKKHDATRTKGTMNSWVPIGCSACCVSRCFVNPASRLLQHPVIPDTTTSKSIMTPFSSHTSQGLPARPCGGSCLWGSKTIIQSMSQPPWGLICAYVATASGIVFEPRRCDSSQGPPGDSRGYHPCRAQNILFLHKHYIMKICVFLAPSKIEYGCNIRGFLGRGGWRIQASRGR